jgi:hypothetical protein
MASLFFSYSHRDETLRDQLETHLAMLKRQGFIEAWHDRRITAGEELDQAINASLEAADIVLLLVSSDFLASDYCYDKEMLRAVERHKAGACTVIPVILRPCDWHDTPFGGLLAAPKDGKPITQWPDIDAAFLDVTTTIKGAIRARPGSQTKSIGQQSSPTSTAIRPAAEAIPRSSNLRITKRFTQRDKEVFLQDAFEFIAKYFENSLGELSSRNPSVETRFRRIDANRFTAVAFRDGEAMARCSIVLGSGSGFASGITYSNNDSASTTSFNESLSVENDDQIIFLKTLGISTLRRGEEKGKLSLEGGAEFYWDMFIEPLQRDRR